MNKVTVGIPVYNAESLLEQGLENLREQTFSAFDAIIMDNASTDSTPAIANAFVAKDKRFSYHRQPYNKGARPNFSDVLAMARTPYFMWRAYDDLSDATFIEALSKLLDDNPQADLAVCTIVSRKPRGDKVRRFPKRGALEPFFIYRCRLLFQSHASWTYALFRTEALQRSFTDLQARFPHLIAADHLTIFPFLMTGRVVGTSDVDFIQRFNLRQAKPDRHPLRDPAEMWRVRSDFFAFCKGSLPPLVANPIEQALMVPVLWFYAGRAYRLPKILSAKLRTWRGERPRLSASGVGYGDGPAKPSE